MTLTFSELPDSGSLDQGARRQRDGPCRRRRWRRSRTAALRAGPRRRPARRRLHGLVAHRLGGRRSHLRRLVRVRRRRARPDAAPGTDATRRRRERLAAGDRRALAPVPRAAAAHRRGVGRARGRRRPPRRPARDGGGGLGPDRRRQRRRRGGAVGRDGRPDRDAAGDVAWPRGGASRGALALAASPRSRRWPGMRRSRGTRGWVAVGAPPRSRCSWTWSRATPRPRRHGSPRSPRNGCTASGRPRGSAGSPGCSSCSARPGRGSPRDRPALLELGRRRPRRRGRHGRARGRSPRSGRSSDSSAPTSAASSREDRAAAHDRDARRARTGSSLPRWPSDRAGPAAHRRRRARARRGRPRPVGHAREPVPAGDRGDPGHRRSSSRSSPRDTTSGRACGPASW